MSEAIALRNRLYFNMAMMLISGTVLSVTVQYQNNTKGFDNKNWRHPYFQSFVAASGQLGGFAVYRFNKWRERKEHIKQVKQEQKSLKILDQSKEILDSVEDTIETKSEDKPQPINRKRIALLLLIPSGFDILEQINRNISNTLLAPSISQMMRSSIVIFTALFSVIFLKLQLFRHHYVSIAAIILGLFLVGLSSFLKGSDANSTRTLGQIGLGIILQLLAQSSGASSYTVEEKFLGDCDQLTPEELIGWEGFWSILFWMICLPILQQIPCSNPDVCARDYVENTLLAFKDYAANPILIIHSVIMAGFTLLINLNGVNITQYGSAAQRTVTDQLRNVTVWIYFLAIPVYGQYLETLSLYSIIQLFGFLILLTGVLVYNEIIIAKFWGLADHVKKYKDTKLIETSEQSKKYRQSLNQSF